jgi:hypothetical protein
LFGEGYGRAIPEGVAHLVFGEIITVKKNLDNFEQTL